MEHICLIIDLDGFDLKNGKFLTREAAYVAMDSDECEVISFDLSEVTINSQEDINSIKYCEEFIHGLPFLPKHGEMPSYPSYLDDFLVLLHNRYSTQSKNIIAYKGGRHEKEKLEELKIPSVNLEIYGCPKYIELLRWYGVSPMQDTCGLHNQSTDRIYHCALAEVKMFKRWVLDRMRGDELRR